VRHGNRREEKMRIDKAGVLVAATSLWFAGASALRAQQPPAAPTAFASAADMQAAVEAMRRDMKPDQGFLWRPLVRGGSAVAALEYWRKPAKPAVHPAEAEYVIVVAGAGTMVSGGTLVDARETKPNLIEGSRIEGGSSRTLRTGDVFLIPAGTPHWFGITGDRLVLLGTKIPQAQR
jgi:mannose-6-phosphate isomerase-like protein (cupin superfamily)